MFGCHVVDEWREDCLWCWVVELHDGVVVVGCSGIGYYVVLVGGDDFVRQVLEHDVCVEDDVI